MDRPGVDKLRADGHEAVPASPESGVDTITGEGMAEVLAGAKAVVDASNAPACEDAKVMEFFSIPLGAAAGVGSARFGGGIAV